MRIGWPATVLVGGLATLAVLVGDLASKGLARQELGGARVFDLPLGIRLEHGENAGVAFGLFAGSGVVLLVVALIAVSGLAVLLLAQSRGTVGSWLAGGLLLGGALANLIDRAGDGSVTDFIDVGGWPTFNLADVAITLGVTLLARGPRSSDKRPEPRTLHPTSHRRAAPDQAGGEDLGGGKR